ncbi:hypothetical protein TSMEX_005031, partial [Taenia solium]
RKTHKCNSLVRSFGELWNTSTKTFDRATMLAGLCFVLDHEPFAGNVIHRHLTANIRAPGGLLPTVDKRFGRLNVVVPDFHDLFLETIGNCWGNKRAKSVKMSRRFYPLKVEEFDPRVEDNIPPPTPPPPQCYFNVIDVYCCKHRFLWYIGRLGVEILHWKG